MGNYENLKQSITEVIRTNGNQEITGAVLQSTLLTIISTVGANATFAGIATPATNPGTPDGPVFYLASESGIYSNFGGVELQDGLSVLMWNGSWSSQQILGVDDVPTAGSDYLVKSGGVYSETSRNTGYINAFFHLRKGDLYTDNNHKIYGPFKAGTKIKMVVSNYTYEGSGQRNVNINYRYNGTTKYAYILYNIEVNEIIEATIEDDTDWIEVQLGYDANCISTTADITILYGSALVELDDVTLEANKGSQLDIALQKNDGTVESPNYRQIAALQLPSATEEKAGLMSAGDKSSIGRIKNVEFSVNTTFTANGQSELITGPFKSGTKILLYTNNLYLNASQGAAIYVSNGSSYIVVNYRNEIKEYTLLADCSALRVGLNLDEGVTVASCDVILAVGSLEITKFKAEHGYDVIPIAESADNSIKGQIVSDMKLTYEQGKTFKPKRIYGDFKQGSVITMAATEYNAPSAGNSYVGISAHFTDNTTANAILLYQVDEGSYTFAKDADYIEVTMGYQLWITTDFSVRVSVRYGYINSLINDINSIQGRISDITEVVDTKASVFMEQSGKISDYMYSSPCYVGFNKPFTKRSLLKYLTMTYWMVSSANVGDSRVLVVGTIDQRNWLLVEKEYTVTVKSVSNFNVTFDLNNIEVQAGQVVFLKSEGFDTERPEVNFGMSAEAYDAENPIYYTTDLNTALQASNWGLVTYKLDIAEIDSIFVTEQSLENINQNIDTLQQETSKINSYTDTITGEPYKIKIVNGQIVAQALNFQKILFIGHSFVVYENSPSADWYLPNGQNRAMAPSVYDNEWAVFVAEKYGAQLTKIGGVDFERNYSPSYNFAQNWNIQDEWDAICVYLNENANYNDTMQESWEAMLNYLKTAAPHAEIFCTASWTAGDKATAIAAACASVSNINYVNLIGLNSNGNLLWNVGDYYIGRDDKYLPMGAPAGHPSDIGHLVIANNFLEKMGQTPLDNKTKSLTLNQSGGGTISTKSLEQVIGAVVSIKCVADSGNYISGMTVVDTNGNNVEVTLRVNGSDANYPRVYYTFIMPNSDVTVTPTWSDTKNYTTYTTTISDTSGGNVKNLNAVCLAGTRCYIYITPNSGKVLSSISATAGGSSLTLTADGDRCYYFDMPAANVTITPVWGNV